MLDVGHALLMSRCVVSSCPGLPAGWACPPEGSRVGRRGCRVVPGAPDGNGLGAKEVMYAQGLHPFGSSGQQGEGRQALQRYGSLWVGKAVHSGVHAGCPWPALEAGRRYV